MKKFFLLLMFCNSCFAQVVSEGGEGGEPADCKPQKCAADKECFDSCGNPEN